MEMRFGSEISGLKGFDFHDLTKLDKNEKIQISSGFFHFTVK